MRPLTPIQQKEIIDILDESIDKRLSLGINTKRSCDKNCLCRVSPRSQGEEVSTLVNWAIKEFQVNNFVRRYLQTKYCYLCTGDFMSGYFEKRQESQEEQFLGLTKSIMEV